MCLGSYSNLQSIFRMMNHLKILVCSSKSVKRLPCLQNNSPVMKTLATLDSLVMNTPGNLDSPVMNLMGSRLLGILYFEQGAEHVYKKKLLTRLASQDSPMY
jgi:hypothetical protein